MNLLNEQNAWRKVQTFSALYHHTFIQHTKQTHKAHTHAMEKNEGSIMYAIYELFDN